MDNSIVITSRKTAGVNVTDIEESNTDCQVDSEPAHVAVEECTSTVTVSWSTEDTQRGEGDQEDSEGGEGDKDEEERAEGDQENSEGGEVDQEDSEGGESEEEEKDDTVAVTGKRKAKVADETSPSKKVKIIDDLCVFVGNLNKSKDLEEVKSSLLTYFITQGLSVKDIKMDLSGKYAYVNMASQTDFTKVLTLNGEQFLDRPMRIAKATGRIKEAAPISVDNKKAKDARCLFVKNIPIRSTKKDLQKIFEQAINIRFPGGSYNPNQGIAFLEFKTESIAHDVMEKKRGTKMQGRVLIVDYVGDKSSHKPSKTPDEAATGTTTTLFVSNLDYGVQEKSLKKLFEKAVSISIPKRTGKPRGIAYIDFETVEDAKEALESSQNKEIRKRSITVKFSNTTVKKRDETFLKDTLIVKGLDKETSEETLKSAFEGALCARLVKDKDTGISKGFGFVDFATEEDCSAAKDVMQDCEIDGSKVMVNYAKPKKH